MAVLALSLVCGLLALGLTGVRVQGAVQCLDNSGGPVDWFIAYKRPSDYAFYYMDARNKVSWTYVNQDGRTLDHDNNAVGHTLNQIYHNKAAIDANQIDFLFGMYSDQVSRTSTSSTMGHSKGVVGFDKATGFWLVHSIPCFPTQTSYSIPLYCASEKSPIYAQTLLCISVNTGQYLDTIGYQLRYNNANVYQQHYSPYFGNNINFANMTSALQKTHRVHDDNCHSLKEIRTLNGQVFQSFAKCDNFSKELYLDLVAPTLANDLYVETWKRGHRLPTQRNGHLWVYNVERVEFNAATGAPLVFNYTKDHAKWVVTGGPTVKYVCIGDINRESSQFKRGGGTVCLQDNSVWNVFRNMVNTYEHQPAGATIG